jgi:hypothetical protein
MKKRCQFSVEFIIIFALVFFIFLLLLAMIIKLADDEKQKAVQKGFDMVADSIQDSLVLALASATNYEAQIYVPENINGLGYEVGIYGKNTLLVNNSEHSSYRDIPYTEGSIVKGCSNKIIKKNGVIKIDGSSC